MLILQVPSSLYVFLEKRDLRTLVGHLSRGIAPSSFRPLRKIPHWCLPKEFGPCLSPNVADHPLRSAIDQSLGRPLPHQQTNQVRAHPMVHKAFSVKTYPVLAQVSSCYSRPKGRYPHVTHPSATKYCYFVRLACVRRAASVRSEPWSNSQV